MMTKVEQIEQIEQTIANIVCAQCPECSPKQRKRCYALYRKQAEEIYSKFVKPLEVHDVET